MSTEQLVQAIVDRYGSVSPEQPEAAHVGA